MKFCQNHFLFILKHSEQKNRKKFFRKFSKFPMYKRTARRGSRSSAPETGQKIFQVQKKKKKSIILSESFFMVFKTIWTKKEKKNFLSKIQRQ